MTLKLSNNASTRLASAVAAGGTSITVAAGTGALFPTLSADDWFPVTVLKSDGGLEIMRCTARSGDVLTVTRAREGTTAMAFSAGDRVELRITKAAMAEFPQGPESAVDNEVARFDGATGKLLKAGLPYQSNRNDTTAGALMINGAHGLGDSSPPQIFDLDARTITSFIREAGATGSPAGGGATSGLHIGGANTDLAIQILARPSGDRIWWRRKNITWAPWMELFHSAAACLLTFDTASLGFGTGSGGTVTQATSKTTAVTLNKPTGRITMNSASLAAGASVAFTLNNTVITGMDTVNLAAVTSTSNYRVEVASVLGGQCNIRVTNLSAVALSDALVINFSVIKGATA